MIKDTETSECPCQVPFRLIIFSIHILDNSRKFNEDVRFICQQTNNQMTTRTFNGSNAF